MMAFSTQMKYINQSTNLFILVVRLTQSIILTSVADVETLLIASKDLFHKCKSLKTLYNILPAKTYQSHALRDLVTVICSDFHAQYCYSKSSVCLSVHPYVHIRMYVCDIDVSWAYVLGW